MKIVDTDLPEVKIIEPQVLTDERGFFMETYSREGLAALGIDLEFVQDNHSFSRKGVLRGLHYQVQHVQAKLVRVISGRVLDVAVDVRRGSPRFGRWVQVELSRENARMVYIPQGFAHGFYVLDDADFVYKCSEHYRPSAERGIIWSDRALAIDWPDSAPLLSPKDGCLPDLAHVGAADLPLYEG